MTDRTTVNVTKDAHTDASSVKDEHDETWSDVLLFYAEYRPDVSINGLGTSKAPIDGIDTLNYDDVKNACATAIRGEIEELQR